MTTQEAKSPSTTDRYNALANLVRALSPTDYDSYPVSQRGRVAEDNELRKFIRDLPEGESFELPGVYDKENPKVNAGLQLYITNYAKSIAMRVKTKKNENGTDLAVRKLTESEIAEIDAEKAKTLALTKALAEVGVEPSDDSDASEEDNEE